MMFDYDEGSIFDPYAFSGKPKKPLKQKPRPPAEINLKPMAKGIQNVGSGAFGIIKTFQTVTSPQYQLDKANRQIRTIEAKEKLMDARQRLATTQREYSEAHPSFIKRMIDKQQQKKSIYTNKKENVMPKA